MPHTNTHAQKHKKLLTNKRVLFNIYLLKKYSYIAITPVLYFISFTQH